MPGFDVGFPPQVSTKAVCTVFILEMIPLADEEAFTLPAEPRVNADVGGVRQP